MSDAPAVHRIAAEIVADVGAWTFRLHDRLGRLQMAGAFRPDGPGLYEKAALRTRAYIPLDAELLIGHFHRGAAQAQVLGELADGGELFVRCEMPPFDGSAQRFIELLVQGGIGCGIEHKKIVCHGNSSSNCTGQFFINCIF